MLLSSMILFRGDQNSKNDVVQSAFEAKNYDFVLVLDDLETG